MNSYQHITNRNEFIQQFRQDQGLTKPLATISPRNNTSERLNKSKVLSGNVSMISSKNTNNEGRWEYLFQLEKLKRSKLDEQRKLKEQQLFQKDVIECTFSPKLNINKSSSNVGYSNGNSGIHIGNVSNSEIINNQKRADTLLNRQQQWNYKKNMRIENIKQYQIMKDNKECIFKPKLNSPDVLQRIEIHEEAKNMLVDPESYNHYVSRIKSYRNNIDNSHKREKSLPGSGNVWTNKVTKPQEFILRTEGNNSKLNIKSINKPLAPNKFNRVKSNYKAGDGRVEKNNKQNAVNLLYARKEETKYDDLEERNKLGIKFDDKVEFRHALKNLHQELHSLDLMGYEA